MLKIAHGEEPFLIMEKVRSWIPNDVSVEKHDMREVAMSDVIMAANTQDLFSEGVKVIICDDCYFLGSEKKLKDDEEALLTEYISNPSPSTLLIFKAGKLDKRKKFVKTLLKIADCYEAKPNKYPQKWLIDRAKQYGKNLSKDAAEYITVRLGTDLFLLDSELQKICVRYLNESKIEVNMLDEVLSRTLENNVFKLIDEVVGKNPAAIETLSDLMQNGNEPVQILLLIARQMRIIQQVLLSKETGLPLQLAIQPYAIQKAKEQAPKYKLDEVMNKVAELAILDLQMKRGEVDKVIALETLILKWLD